VPGTRRSPSIESIDKTAPVTRLLLVDDDESNLLSLDAALEGTADELVSVRSGEEALREILERDFAAILLDVKMPGLDGFETAEMIRNRKRSRHTPILFLTGYRSDDQLFRGYHLGAVDFLFKPIIPEILRSKVSVFVELARNANLVKQQAEILGRAEQRFRMLLEAAPDAMLILGEDGRITLVNTRTEELFQRKRRELLDRHFSELVPQWTFATQAHGMEMLAACSNGKMFPADLTSSPLRTEEGLLTTVVVRDISERKLAEERIRRLNSELESRVAARTKELVRSNETLRQFAWAASHDLQEPLRNIIIFSQLLARKITPEQNEEGMNFLDEILTGGRRLERLLQALREYVQASDAGQHELVATDALSCLKGAIENLGASIVELDAKIEHGPLPRVFAVPVLLIQIFQNLIGNSLKYRSSEPVRIRIDHALADEEFIFSVQDNGIGIDAEYHDRVFGVFKRLGAEMEGIGMGLAICKTAVERWGGRIWVESEVGRGSTFRFTIPNASGSS
jgi:PAS domain S-box-containing protein